jgi:2-oxoglutarate/2-oxoacid ferredoxin oxidoreductase subunit beta
VLKGSVGENPQTIKLRQGMMPHMWCPGCGIGVIVSAFLRALGASDLPEDKTAFVCGIGCTGRAGGYVDLDAFHTTHGRAIPFATGLKLSNPELQVVVFGGDGDIAAIGGNHLMHAAHRNMDLLVVCVNNFNYGMTGGQASPTTPMGATLTTVPYGSFSATINMPLLADACGASYVARWTTYHLRQMERTFREALSKKGFRFVEVISPCPTLYERRNRLGDGVDRMRFYKDNSVVRNGADTRDLEIGFDSQIVVGKFVDRERETFAEAMNRQLTESLGSRYVLAEQSQG